MTDPLPRSTKEQPDDLSAGQPIPPSDDEQEVAAGGDPTQPSAAPPPPTTPLPLSGGSGAGSSLGRTASRAVFWNTVLFPLRFLASLIGSVILTNFFPRADYGLVVLISATAATVGLYGDLGTERSLPRFVPEVERAGGAGLVRRFLGQLIGFKLLVMAGLVLGLIAFSGPLLELAAAEQNPTTIAHLQRNGFLFVLAVCAMLVLGALFDTFMQFLSSYFKQRAWNAITIASGVLQPLLIVMFFALGGARIELVVMAMVVSPAISVGLAGWQAARLARNPVALREGGAAVGGTAMRLPTGFLARFSRYSALAYFLNVSASFYTLPVVSFVLYGFYHADGTALFAVAYNFVNSVLAALWSPLSGVQIPLFSRIYSAERANPPDGDNVGAGLVRPQSNPQLQDSYELFSKFLALVLIPAGVGLAILSGNLFAIMFASYREAAGAAVLLTAFLFAEALISIPQNIMIVYERFRPVLVSRAIALISIPLLLVLIPLAGGGGNAAAAAAAAAVATGLARLLSRVWVLFAAARSLHLRYPTGFALRVAAAAAVMAVVVGLGAGLVSPLAAGIEVGTVEKAGALFLNLLVTVAGAATFLLTFKRLGGLDEADHHRLARLKLPLPGWAWRLL